jgi:hypothetical protein
MAEPTQFTFSWVEATEALIKKQGLHEGKWMLVIEYAINVGLMGTTPPEVRQGVMMLANGLQLQKAVEPGAPPNMVVDAAIVNPIEEAKPPE